MSGVATSRSRSGRRRRTPRKNTMEDYQLVAAKLEGDSVQITLRRSSSSRQQGRDFNFDMNPTKEQPRDVAVEFQREYKLPRKYLDTIEKHIKEALSQVGYGKHASMSSESRASIDQMEVEVEVVSEGKVEVSSVAPAQGGSDRRTKSVTTIVDDSLLFGGIEDDDEEHVVHKTEAHVRTADDGTADVLADDAIVTEGIEPHKDDDAIGGKSSKKKVVSKKRLATAEVSEQMDEKQVEEEGDGVRQPMAAGRRVALGQKSLEAGLHQAVDSSEVLGTSHGLEEEAAFVGGAEDEVEHQREVSDLQLVQDTVDDSGDNEDVEEEEEAVDMLEPTTTEEKVAAFKEVTEALTESMAQSVCESLETSPKTRLLLENEEFVGELKESEAMKEMQLLPADEVVVGRPKKLATVTLLLYVLAAASFTPFYLLLRASVYLFETVVMDSIIRRILIGKRKPLPSIEAVATNYVVITGATSALGKRITLNFARKGLSCLLVDSSSEELMQFVDECSEQFEGIRFKWNAADLGDFSVVTDIQDFCETYNVVALVNNAGNSCMEHNGGSEAKLVMATTRSFVTLALGFARAFANNGNGRICHVYASAVDDACDYSILKASNEFARSLCKTLDENYRAHGVGASIVAPSTLRTAVAEYLGYYKPEYIAKQVVDATLRGDSVIHLDPISLLFERYLKLYGEEFNASIQSFFAHS